MTAQLAAAEATMLGTAPFEAPTATTVSVNQLGLDVAMLAKALADVTDRRIRTTWESEAARDNTLGPPTIADAVSWLPHGAELLFGRQNVGACQILARVSAVSYAQLTAYMDRVEILVADDDPDHAQDLGQSIADQVPGPRQLPDTVLVGVWSGGPEGPLRTSTSVAAPPWETIERNYPDTIRRHLSRLMGHTPADATAGRLVLFHGPSGTGKTHAIRALMARWQPWCDAELVVDPEHGLFDYPYLQRLLSATQPRVRRRDRWRLVVAEDADRVVRHGGADALDRLLNATDGILGQGSKTIFLLTTNVALATVHPAIARPGRCLAAIHFDRFDRRQARQWLGDTTPPPTHELTLAELYEQKAGSGLERRRSQAAPGQYL